jgi:hypothetical protein
MTDITAEALSSRISGRVLEGEEAVQASRPWNHSYSNHSALVAFPNNAEEVASCVAFAAENRLPIGVQCTGHGVVRSVAGGLLIMTTGLTDLEVDVEARTARIGAGLEWAPVIAATEGHGLSSLHGSSPFVGAVGYTVGGGMGWLGRKHGLQSESVISFQVVTPDGVLRTASADENPDLFWALRGAGGGSLGVITEMTIHLVPVTEVYAGNLYYPAADAHEVIAMFAAWCEKLPEEMTAAIVLQNFPNLDSVPEHVRGKSFAIIRGAWCGPLSEGAALVDRLRQQKEPVIDHFGPLPWTECAKISNDPIGPVTLHNMSECLTSLDPDVAEVLVARTFPPEGHPRVTQTEARICGGALERGDGPATRGLATSPYTLVVIGPHHPETPDLLPDYLAAFRQDLAPHVTGHAYPNFMDGPERAERSSHIFTDEDWQRVQAVKAETDPRNAFRYGVDLKS